MGLVLIDNNCRLWQESGQTALENARVCVLGSTALAAETLKNLVLPGIGEFVVVDDGVVGEQDTLTNFFVQVGDQGKLRAECIVQGLSELNPDVKGSAVTRSPAELLASTDPADIQLVASATLVLACGQPESVVCALSRRCWQANVPLVAADVAGFYARVRTSIPEHADTPSDLRLLTPFPALRNYIDEIDFGVLDSTDLAHVPYPVIIVKALKALSLDGSAAAPTIQQKRALRDLIGTMAPSPDEENFAQAVDAVTQHCKPYSTPDVVDQILNDPAAAAPLAADTKVDRFWLLASALRAYMLSDYSQGMLPLNGSIPDMKADTKGYVALQRIYKQRAAEDAAQFATHVARELTEAGLPADFISSDEVAVFCRNACNLRLLRFTPLHDEIEGDSLCSTAKSLVAAEVASPYALFRASARFEATHGRYPGVTASPSDAEMLDDEVVANDAAELIGIANSLLAEWGLASDAKVDEDLAMEFARSGRCELHNISSMTGGIVSQEAIKLITHQYVPENSLCVVDGVKAKSYVAKI
ncbi:hypothetical protein GGI18_002240 [Coemansia linderi]|uniref:Uncharacterized protein n=1 Tax=Coemansia linderi TaxID=2663919 RepID=A0ACC1KGU8_9FUNG|nr:hypothetical protein GGI18_002240 [Coemansia linderi]